MKILVFIIMTIYLGIGIGILHYLYLWYTQHYHSDLRCSFPGFPTIYWQPYKKALLWVPANILLCTLASSYLTHSIALAPNRYPLSKEEFFITTCLLSGTYIISTILSQLTTSASISKIVVTAFLFLGYIICSLPYFGFGAKDCFNLWLSLLALFITFTLAWIPGTKKAYEQKKGQGMFPEAAFMIISAFIIFGGGIFLNGLIYLYGK